MNTNLQQEEKQETGRVQQTENNSSVELTAKDYEGYLVEKLLECPIQGIDATHTRNTQFVHWAVQIGRITEAERQLILSVLENAYKTRNRKKPLPFHQIESEPQVISRPPRLLEAFISLLTPREKEEELLANLAAYYADEAERYGEKWARVLYCKEVGRSLVPALKLAARYQVLHYLSEIIHRVTGH